MTILSEALQNKILQYAQRLGLSPDAYVEYCFDAQAQLTATLDRYRTITEVMSDYAFHVDFDPDDNLVLRWMTPSVTAVTGYSLDDVKHRRDWHHPDDVERANDDLQRLIDENVATVGEYRYRHADGHWIWLRVHRKPIWDDVQQRVIGFLGTSKDITTEKEAQRAYEELSKRYQQISEVMSDYAYEVTFEDDGTVRIIWVTDTLSTVTGYTTEQLLSNREIDWSKLTYPDDIARLQRDVDEMLTQHKTVRSEYRSYHADGHLIWLQITRKPILDKHGQKVIGFVGAAKDITAEKEAQQAYEELNKRYQYISDITTDYASQVKLNDDGTSSYTWMSDNLHTILGHSSHISYKERWERVHPDDRAPLRADIQRLRDKKISTSSQYRYRHGNSNWIWLNVRRKPLLNDAGIVTGYVVAANNITAEKETTQALEELNKRYQAISELTSDYAFYSKVLPGGQYENDWVTQAIEPIIGYMPQELKYFEASHYHPDDQAQLVEDLRQVVVEKKKCQGEYRFRHKAGHWVWLRIHREPVIDESGKVIGFYGATKDITQEKAQEQALRESEERYRQISELVSDFSYYVEKQDDGTLEVQWITPTIKSITGYNADETNHLNSINYHPDDKDQLYRDVETVTTHNKKITNEYRFKHADGHWLWLRISREPVFDKEHQEVIGVMCAVTDITEEKEAKQSLQELTERYRILSESSTDYAFLIHFNDENNFILQWATDTFERITGYPIPTVGTKLGFKHMTDNATLDATGDIAQMIQRNEVVSGIYQMRHADGHLLHLQITRTPVWDESKQAVIGYIAAGKDITARREAEIALKASEERYRQISEVMSDFAYQISIDYTNPTNPTLTIDWLTDSFEQVMGYAVADVLHLTTVPHFVHDDDHERQQADVQKMFEDNTEISGEYRLIHANGQEMWGYVRRKPIWDEQNNRVSGYIGAVTDITARKQAETALYDSEKRYRQVSEIMSDYAYSVRYDEEETLRLDWVTTSMTQAVGYPLPQLGEELSFKITHPDDVSRMRSEVEEMFQKGEKLSSQSRIRHADGHWLTVEITRQPILDDTHTNVIGYVAAIRNISEQKAAEDALYTSEARYKAISQFMSDFAYEIRFNENDEIVVEWMNDVIEYVMGFPPHDKGTVLTWQHTHPDDVEAAKAIIDLMRSQNIPVSSVSRIRHAEGHYLWIQRHLKPIWDEAQQKVIGAYVAGRDITNDREIQASLQASEKRYQVLSNLLMDYAYTASIDEDNNPHIEWVTENFANIIGRKPQEGERINIKESTHPDDIKRLAKAWDTTLKQNKVTQTEYRMVIDDEVRWIRVVRQPVWDETQQRVIRVYGAAKDITAQKEAENQRERYNQLLEEQVAERTKELQIINEQLRESEARYREISELSMDFAYSYSVKDDGSLEPEWITDAFLRLTGFDIDDMRDPELQIQLVHPDGRWLMAAINEQISKNQPSTHFEHRINTKSGSIRHVVNHVKSVWDDKNERVIRYIGAVQDISDRKIIEYSLRQERNLLQSIMDTSPTAIVVADISGQIVFKNQTATVILGDIYTIADHPLDNCLQIIIQTKQAVFNQEYTHETPYNGTQLLSINGVPQWDDNGHLKTAVFSVADISFRREWEQQTEQALHQERQLHELKSRFVTLISHELRTPLAIILTSSELIIRYLENGDYGSIDRRTRRIQAQVTQLRRIMDDVNFIHKMDNIGYKLNISDIALPNFLKTEVSELTLTYDHHAPITVDLDDNLQDVRLDESLLHQITTNLISNALKYTPTDGEIAITGSIISDTDFELHFSDKGIGIPDKDQKHLFKSFHRAENVGNISGTGLGLSIVKQAVTALGGSINFKSKINEGTQFIVRLPLTYKDLNGIT